MVVNPLLNQMRWGSSNTEPPFAAIETGKKAVRIWDVGSTQSKTKKDRPNVLEIEAIEIFKQQPGSPELVIDGLHEGWQWHRQPKDGSKLGMLFSPYSHRARVSSFVF